MTDWSLSPRSFVMTLITQFSRDIGLKSLTVVGEFTFGIRVMNELLIACRSIVPLKKSKQSL
jgi:hypothetical protein